MADKTGHNESRTLESGEIVYLLKEPGKNWKISSYECHQRVVFDVAAGGFALVYKQGLPKEWQEREFDTADNAASFVQTEIDDGRIPANSKPPGQFK